jgi:hypothetical protein
MTDEIRIRAKWMIFMGVRGSITTICKGTEEIGCIEWDDCK